MLFKDFNITKLGKLMLSEFNNMLRFMQIKADNSIIRDLFTRIDTFE